MLRQVAVMADANWKNRTIFTGDNLHVMRGMNSDSVDLIYLDPPFNSNRYYEAPIGSRAAGSAFKDAWHLDDVDEEWHYLIGGTHPGLFDLLNATKTIHGKRQMAYLIYMSIRLMEMRRILKPTGSIYLHCDWHASHYLKLVMDSLFGVGKDYFRSSIVWQRASGRQKGSQYEDSSYGNDYDSILFYTSSADSPFKVPYRQLTSEEEKEKFPLKDANGRYNTNTPIFRSPSMENRPNLCYTYNSVTNPHPSGWRVSEEKLREMDEKGEIIWREGKTPLRKSYAEKYKGKKSGNLWLDIPNVTVGKQKTDYRTQKPLLLLERIIQASSNKGDIVLDPFCGCATTCIAAEKLQRQWVGIDISSAAARLVTERTRNELGLFSLELIHRTDIPHRTDIGKIKKYNHPDNIDYLYSQQNGRCNGCKHHFPKQNMTVDHKVSQNKGGGANIGNLQLLCAHCNSIKGGKLTHEELLVELKKRGHMPPEDSLEVTSAIYAAVSNEIEKIKNKNPDSP